MPTSPVRRLNLLLPTVLAASAVLLACVPLGWLAVQSFDRLERETASEQLTRAENLLDAESEAVAAKAADWAYWSSLHAHLTEPDPTFAAENLTPANVVVDDIDLVYVYSVDGSLAWSMVLDAEGEPGAQAPSRLAREDLGPDSWLWPTVSVGEPVDGYLVSDGGVYGMATAPVLTDSRAGPRAGAVVVARRFDAARIEALSDALRAPLVLEATSDGEASSVSLRREDRRYVAARSLADVSGDGIYRVGTRSSGDVLDAAADMLSEAAAVALIVLWVLVAFAALVARLFVVSVARRSEAELLGFADEAPRELQLSAGAEAVKYAIRAARPASIIGLLLCLGLAVYLSVVVPLEVLVPWLGAALAGVLARTLQLARLEKRAARPDCDWRKLMREFVLGVPLNVVPMVLGLAYFTRWTSGEHESVVAIVLVAMVGGASVAYATTGAGFLAYMLPLLLVPVAYVVEGVLTGSSLSLVVGLLLLGGLVLKAFVHRILLVSTLTLFELRGQREQLLTQLAEANAALAEERNAYQAASLTDALTGLANRRQFDLTLEREWSRGGREGTPVSCAMIDVDCFKAYNDHYGHERGDECLQRVAEVLQSAIRRKSDLLARYGGEEFVVVMPHTREVDAQHQGERLRAAVEAAALPHGVAPAGAHLTVSVGVSTRLPDADASAGELVRLADTALYESKRAGRNRVSLAESRVIHALDDTLADAMP